jgi:hypothetical protein
MRVTLAVAALGLLGCSVYDDALVTRGEPVTPQLVQPGAAGATSRQPSNTLEAGGPSSLAADGGVRCSITAGADYCTQLPRLLAAPAIDGALECGLVLSPMQPLGWKSSDAKPDKSANYAAAWHRDGLYVYVEVHGPPVVAHPASEPIFCGDAVEVYVDADAETDDAGTYDAMGTMQFVVAAPSSGAPPDAWRFKQGESQGAWISQSLHATPLPDGYSVEAFITGPDVGLWQWLPEGRLGFSLAIDVASAQPGLPNREGCTSKSGQFFLRLADPHGSCPGEPWCDAKAFCSAALLQ